MLYIVRGAADSNRDQIAKQLVVEHNGVQIEADDYFVADGVYTFNPFKLEQAHQWCLNQVKMHLRAGRNVILSNTSTELWEFKPYMEYCNRVGISFDIFYCLEKGTNKYNTPDKACVKQRKRFMRLTTILDQCKPLHSGV